MMTMKMMKITTKRWCLMKMKMVAKMTSLLLSLIFLEVLARKMTVTL